MKKEKDFTAYDEYAALTIAIWWAKEHKGYNLNVIDQLMVKSAGAEKFEGSLRLWANGLIFDHDFAKAIFGQELYDYKGSATNFYAIRLWCKQVAFEIFGKVHRVDRERREYAFIKPVDLSLEDMTAKAPADIVGVEQVVMQLKDMAGSISFTTHELSEVDVMGGIPAWQWHLREMIVADNPYKYLLDYINKRRDE